MKTSTVLITVVVALHGVALGSLFFMQGCSTPSRRAEVPAPPETLPPMPPTVREPMEYPPVQPAQPAAMPPASAATPAAPEETTDYTVRPGDTLSGIAHQYRLSVNDLVALNKLADPNKVRAGQKLLLPGRVTIKPAAAKPKAKPAAKPAAAAPASAAALHGTEYTVVSGDNLSKIAKRCGVSLSALRAANALQSDRLQIGQKLKIPEAAAPAAPAPVSQGALVPAPVVSAEPAPAAAEGVPAEPAAAPAAAEGIPAEPPAAAPAAGLGVVHTVQPGEDLPSIAKLYATTVDELASLNQLGDARTVQPGQRLNIP